MCLLVLMNTRTLNLESGQIKRETVAITFGILTQITQEQQSTILYERYKMFELITAPFIILCVLVAIAFFIGMKVGEDNQKNRNE
jgi:H+/gluconate symporter-like permease